VDESKLPDLVLKTKAAGTWQVPTEILFVNLMTDESPDSLRSRPEMKYVENPKQLDAWVEQKKKFLQVPAADRQKFLALRRQLLKALFDAGVPFALARTRHRCGTCRDSPRTASLVPSSPLA
jgi:hypothetical protein